MGEGKIELVAVTGDVKGRLVVFQMKFLAPMMENFDARIKIPDCTAKIQNLFDFRKMPLGRVKMDETKAPSKTHGGMKIEWAVTELLPGLGVLELKREALAVRLFVLVHQDEFRFLVDPKKPEKGWGLCLSTIFGRLNRERNALSMPIPSYLHGPDYAPSFMWQFCNSELSGSHISRVKTRERTGLLKGSFNSVVFGTSNHEPVQDIETPRLVSKRRAEGQLIDKVLVPPKKASQR